MTPDLAAKALLVMAVPWLVSVRSEQSNSTEHTRNETAGSLQVTPSPESNLA